MTTWARTLVRGEEQRLERRVAAFPLVVEPVRVDLGQVKLRMAT